MSKRFLWVFAVALVIVFVGGYLAAVDVVGAHAERMEQARAEAEARAAAAATARGLERTIAELRGRVRLQARELPVGGGPEALTQLEERIGRRAKARLAGPAEAAELVALSPAAGGAVVGFAAGETARLVAAASVPAVAGAEAQTLIAVVPIAPSLLSAGVELHGTHLVAQLGKTIVASTLSAKVAAAGDELVVDGVRFASSVAAVRDDAGAELKIAAYAPLEAALPFAAALRVVFLIAGGGALAFLFLGAGLLGQRTPTVEASEAEPADEPEEGLASLLEGDELGGRVPPLGEPTVPLAEPDRIAREAEAREAAAREAEAREAEAAAALEMAAREAAAREMAAREAAAREAAAREAAAREMAAREAAALEMAAREAAAREAAALERAARELAAAHPTPDPFAGNVANDGLRAALGETARREVVPAMAFGVTGGFGGEGLPDVGDRATRRGASTARPVDPGYLPPLPELAGAGLSGDLRVPGGAATPWPSPEPRGPTQGKGASPAPRPRAGPEAPLPVGTGTWSPPPPEALSRPPAPVGPDARPFDEEHYRVVFADFVAAKERLGENVEAITVEGFTAKLRTSERQLLEKHGCRAVRFQVVVKERTVSLRPQLVR